MSALIPWLVFALPALTLGLGLVNLFTWPRPRRSEASVAGVSVLIPARDEAANIEACVRAALAAPVREVLVYDDHSTDDTPAILARLAAEDPRLHVLAGGPLPPGWVGKPHACHRLAEAAQGDLLLFVDADVRLAPDGPARLATLLDAERAQLLTAVPRQRMESFAERLVLPLLHLTYVSWFPLALTHKSRDVRFLAANGQLLMARRQAYRSVGGFSAVRDAVVDDMALCRRAKRAGLRVVFADGHHVAACRMYSGWPEIWSGFAKNLYPGLGGRPCALAVAVALYLAAFVLPYGALVAGLPGAGWAVAANLVLRTILALRHRQPPEGVLLHPLGVLALVAIAVESWRRTRQGRLTWRGRVYRPAPSEGGGA
ncbi:MAG: glycosyltransferase [Myxococcales bacterium]|nr:glycosyltransferase [Myxococcales bacterium]